jgi:hypothetical protein
MSKEEKAGIAGASSTQSAKEIENTQWTKYKGPKGGHGFAAEDANALNDKLKGKKVEKTGTNNELNGADRIVDGKMIQTKYYNSAKGSIEAGFDPTTGKYRYNGQVLEVPKDQYEDAIRHMKQKILEGKVPGYTDPEKAAELVKQGDVTYKQALNIAKAGNIDSLWFDIKNQAVVTSCAFGISFIITYAIGIWRGLNPKQAFKIAFASALKTGAAVLIVGIGTQQLLRTSFGRSFAAFTTRFSRQIVTKLYSTKAGKDIIEKVASAIMKKALYGAAAKNVVSRILRSNWVTATVTSVVLAVPDTYRVIIKGSISWEQFSKNIAVTGAGLGGGIGGAMGGAAAGAYIGGAIGTAIAPGPGTAAGAAIGAQIGTWIGGIGGGIGTSIGVKKIADLIAQDDAEIMIESMNKAIEELAFEYMLTEDELKDIIVPKIQSTVNPKWLKDMFTYSGSRSNITGQKEFVEKEMGNYFDEIIKNKDKVQTPKKIVFNWMAFKIKVTLFFEYVRISISSFFGNKAKENFA